MAEGNTADGLSECEAALLKCSGGSYADHKRVVLVACGSFSPITYMHLRIFEMARDALGRRHPPVLAVKGVISPVGDGYNKKGLASGVHRLEMCRRAVLSSDWIEVDDWEVSQPEVQLTAHVLEHFEEKYAPHGLHPMLLCGSDLLESFNSPGVWSQEDQETIVARFGCAVIDREGASTQETVYKNDILFREQGNICIVHQFIPNNVSSTRVRLNLKRNLSIKYLTPDPVIEYIQEHKLYQTEDAKE